MPERAGHSVNDLLRRGWTRGMVQRLLGDEDWSERNPHYPSGAPMKLYARPRVEAAEGTDEFKAWIARPNRPPKSS